MSKVEIALFKGFIAADQMVIRIRYPQFMYLFGQLIGFGITAGQAIQNRQIFSGRQISGIKLKY